MKYGQLTLGQNEAILNKVVRACGGGEDSLGKVLSGVIQLTAKVVSYIITTYHLWVDGPSISDLPKAGGYDWTNPLITEWNFPTTEYDMVEEKETALFHFNRTISSEDAIAGMRAEGYRPATMRELLTFGKENPEVQRKFPIVALGQVVRLDGARHVGYLDRDGSGRCARLHYFDDGWSGDCRFLAVCN